MPGVVNYLVPIEDHLHLSPRKRIAQYARERFSPELAGAKLHAVYQSLRLESKGQLAKPCIPT